MNTQKCPGCPICKEHNSKVLQDLPASLYQNAIRDAEKAIEKHLKALEI